MSEKIFPIYFISFNNPLIYCLNGARTCLSVLTNISLNLYCTFAIQLQSNGGVVKPSSPRLSIIELRSPFERVDDNKMDFLQQQNVDRRPRKRKATVQQRSPTRTKDQHVTSTVSSLSPWKSALRASYEAQNNFGGQTNALTKNVRFSNINKVNPTQRQMEAVVYSSPSTPAEPTNLNVSEFSNEKFPPIALINSPLIKGSRATASKSRRKHRIAPDCAKAIFDNADSNDRTINEVCYM